MDAPSQHCGGVAVLYGMSPLYTVEVIQLFRTNFVGFQLTTGERQWYIIGCYLSPNDTLTIESFVAALKERP